MKQKKKHKDFKTAYDLLEENKALKNFYKKLGIVIIFKDTFSSIHDKE